jgi:hypothetical protein
VRATQIKSPPQGTYTSTWLVNSFALLAMAVVLLMEELTTAYMPTQAVIWGSLALVAYLLGLFCLLGNGQSPILGLARWQFGPWTLLWYALTFGLASIAWNKPQQPPADQIAVNSVLRALCLVAVAMTLWTIGYLIGPSQPIRRGARRFMEALANYRTSRVRGRSTPWVIYAVGVSARVLTVVTTGRFGYVGDPASALSAATGYEQVLSELSLLCPLAVCAAALQLYRERLPSAWATLMILFVLELAFGAAAGGKGSFVIALLAVVIPMSAMRRRLPKFAVIGGLIIFMLVVIPFNHAYRNAVRGGPALLSTSEALNEAPTLLWQAVTAQGPLDTFIDSTTYLLQRVQEIDGPAIIMQLSPGQIPFISPSQLIEAPLAGMIPRAVWPDKPISSPGYEFSQQYYNIPSSIYTASAITSVGDMYRHGGWIPVIIGMFLLGCGIRLLDEVLDIRDNPHAIFLILLLFPNFVQGELDWTSLVAGLPATLFVWLLAISLVFRATPRHRRAH